MIIAVDVLMTKDEGRMMQHTHPRPLQVAGRESSASASFFLAKNSKDETMGGNETDQLVIEKNSREEQRNIYLQILNAQLLHVQSQQFRKKN